MSFTPKSASYTVQDSDNGTTFVLEGTNFDTLTFPNPASLTLPFSVNVTNTKARAEWIHLIASSGISPCSPDDYLWPLQGCTILANDQGGWTRTPAERWRIGRPANGGGLAQTLNVDPTYGSDGYGVTDGLATGTGAFKSFMGASSVICQAFDANGGQLKVQMVGTGTDPVDLHASVWGGPILGGNGGAGVVWDGGGGTMAGQVQGYYGYMGTFQNMEFTGGIDMARGSSLSLYTGISFGPSLATHIQVTNRSRVEIFAGYSVSGGAPYHIGCDNSSVEVMSGGMAGTIVGSGLTFSGAFVGAANLGRVKGFDSWNNTAGVTGTLNYSASDNAVISGVTVLPGSGGSPITGAQVS